MVVEGKNGAMPVIKRPLIFCKILEEVRLDRHSNDRSAAAKICAYFSYYKQLF